MERIRELHAIWNWLPAFRVVAETEHLPSAAKALRVTPSALSRTVRHLEEALGHDLFDREGRSIKLNPAGERLLHHLRGGMRLVHDGLLALQDELFVGPVHIAAPGPFVPTMILPALRVLKDEHPDLVPQLHAVADAAQVDEMLRTGGLDLALLDDPLPNDELDITELHTMIHDVFASSAAIDREHLRFVAPHADARGQRPDAWPPDRPRTVGLSVSRMQTAIDAVRDGGYVAVLPRIIGESVGLHALGFAGLPSTTLYLARRPTLGSPGRTEIAAEAITRTLARALG